MWKTNKATTVTVMAFIKMLLGKNKVQDSVNAIPVSSRLTSAGCILESCWVGRVVQNTQ